MVENETSEELENVQEIATEYMAIEDVTETEETGDWLTDHGITITPQGNFTFKAYEYDGETGATIGDFDVSGYVTINEYTEGVEEGYKQVVASYTLDLSANTGGRSKYSTMTFDKYTGIAFAKEAGVGYTNYIGDSTSGEDTMVITVGDKTYDVVIEEYSENQYPTVFRAIIVTCPIEYDGVVFRIGYVNPEMQEEYLQMDFTDKMYTIDEFPFYESEYPACYFTLTNN